jgi:hypothetical protein
MAPIRSEADAEQLPQVAIALRGAGLVSQFRIDGRQLPSIRVLEKSLAAPPQGYRHGGYETWANAGDDLTDVRWPSGWTLLRAAAREHLLEIRPSTPGRAAARLIRQLAGEPEGMYPLASPEILALLDRLCERAGATMFKSRLREMTRAGGDPADPAALARIEAKLDGMVRQGDDDAYHSVSHDALRALLGSPTACRNFLDWAERCGLLVRGVVVKCDRCGRASWKPVGGLAPPILCSGCGVPIGRPFQGDSLAFRVRASEALLRAGDCDALTNVLAFRWLVGALSVESQRGSGILGAFPGVEILESGSAEPFAEVDLLVLTAEGDLVPGECKRRGAGLTAAEVAKLLRVQRRLQAPWCFVATADAASDCGAIWQGFGSRQPLRFAVTGDHLFDLSLIPSLGVIPWEWRQLDDGAKADRLRRYQDAMAEMPERQAWATDPDWHLFNS